MPAAHPLAGRSRLPLACGSDGSVITLANSYRDELVRRDPEAAALFVSPTVASLTKDGARLVAAHARSLQRELAWIAPGHRTAVGAALALIVVQAVRALAVHRHEGAQSRSRHAELVARFRALVEDRFRLREPVATYAAELGVSPTTLRTACALVAGTPPAENSTSGRFSRRSVRFATQTRRSPRLPTASVSSTRPISPDPSPSMPVDRPGSSGSIMAWVP